MKRFISSLAALSLAGTALAQGMVTQTVTLQHTKASETAKRLKAVPVFFTEGRHTRVKPLLPAGTKVSADDAKNTLTIQGSAEAVTAAKAVLMRLDAPTAGFEPFAR